MIFLLPGICNFLLGLVFGSSIANLNSFKTNRNFRVLSYVFSVIAFFFITIFLTKVILGKRYIYMGELTGTYCAIGFMWFYIGTTFVISHKSNYGLVNKKVIGILSIIAGLGGLVSLGNEDSNEIIKSLDAIYALTLLAFGSCLTRKPKFISQINLKGNTSFDPVIVNNTKQIDQLINQYCKNHNSNFNSLGKFENETIAYQFFFKDIKRDPIIKYFKIEPKSKLESNELSEKIGNDTLTKKNRHSRLIKNNVSKVNSLKPKIFKTVSKAKNHFSELLKKDEIDIKIKNAKKELELKRLKKEIEKLDGK